MKEERCRGARTSGELSASSGGYWTVTADGTVTAHDGAQTYGSAANLALHQPIVGIASTTDGGGYWLVAADGGVFAYGDATFHGSLPATPGAGPAAGFVTTTNGYAIIGANGTLHTYPA